MSVGENIRRIRKEKKISAKELGEKIGCSGNAILLYERNERKVTVEMLNEISNALEVKPNDLYDSIGSYFDDTLNVNQIKKDLNKAESISKILEFYDYKLYTEDDFNELDMLIKMFVYSKKYEDSQKGKK